MRGKPMVLVVTHPTGMPKIARLLLLVVNIVCGLLPSVAWFAWMERNASLPAVIARALGFPWIDLATEGVAVRATWDFGLILAFGLIHSVTAQESVQREAARVLPKDAIRALYVTLTGFCVTSVMGLWQSTGIVIWALPLGWTAMNAISLVLFWSLVLLSFAILSRFGALEFLGLGQLISGTSPGSGRTAGSPRLVQSGVYRYVRHPAYAILLLALAATPLMTLDRLIILAAIASYLVVGIPVEERKLVAQFGGAYLDYRRRVPAVMPSLRRSL